jgi:hypothetical protein
MERWLEVPWRGLSARADLHRRRVLDFSAARVRDHILYS